MHFVSLLYSFPLYFRYDSVHIPAMAQDPKKSAKNPPRKTTVPGGFEEAPQAPLSGTPLSGNVSDWVKQLEADAEASAFESQREVASKAGKHRKKVEIAAKSAAGRKPEGASEPMRGPRGAKAQGADSVSGRTSRGTSMGGTTDPKTRAAAGLNPVAGLDVSLEDADKLSTSGVTATVEALSALIESGNPLFKDGKLWTPHRPARPPKTEGGIEIRMVSDYEPAGDQPTAIADLVEGLASGERSQVLLGVTGSGKTFTMAKVIEATQRPAVILAPNKTLAAQLYSEFKNFFPDNAVEYFVSYYDYYQPEAYVPRSDTFIEKESSINEQIDRMRHAATRALIERDDVIIVASVSCIYGIGSVETYTAMTFQMSVGDTLDQRQLLADLVAQQYKRRDMDFQRGSFRVRGDTIEIFPAHLEDAAWRISMFGDEIKRLKAAELAAMDDPMAREEAKAIEGGTGRKKATAPNSGKASPSPSSSALSRGPTTIADDNSLFQKPSLDDMGPGTDTERPLFRKPELDEMGRDVATPAGRKDAESQSLFRKNSLDEMTVGRTEKPVIGKVPDKPLIRAKPGVGSYEDPVDEKRQKGRTKGKTGRPGK